MQRLGMYAVKMQMPGALPCHGVLFVDKLGPILNGVRGLGSSVGRATDYGLDGSGSNQSATCCAASQSL